MANMVSSAVVQEAVSQILSDLINRHDGKEKSKASENLERLEMAHIKLEAALETSEKWQITGESLLRWRKKLKRAAQECDDTLHRCKSRILEEEQVEDEVRNSAFPKRIAHATKSFISSAFHLHDNNNNQMLRTSDVRRFEWYADGACDFLRFVELGCSTPYCHMPFNPFIRNLFSGKKLQHRIDDGNGSTFFVLWLPFVTAEHGVEVSLIFIQRDDGNNEPENNFYFSIMLQLSESTDIVGIAVRCLQLFTPLFRSRVEVVRSKIMKLPTQDFEWVPFDDPRQKEHWDNLVGCVSQWLRPNPSCCKQVDLHEHEVRRRCSDTADTSSSDVSLEPVIEAHLECQVSLDDDGGEIGLRDSEYLIAGLLFMPHGGPSEDLPPSPADKSSSSAISVNHSEEQRRLHTDITLAQLQEITVPKAVEYFRRNADASSVYQMVWKSSKQGAAYIHVVKGSSTEMMQSARRMMMIQGRQGGKVVRRDHVVPQFLNLWVGHAPTRLQGSIVDWIEEEGKSKLAFSPLRLEL